MPSVQSACVLFSQMIGLEKHVKMYTILHVLHATVAKDSFLQERNLLYKRTKCCVKLITSSL